MKGAPLPLPDAFANQPISCPVSRQARAGNGQTAIMFLNKNRIIRILSVVFAGAAILSAFSGCARMPSASTESNDPVISPASVEAITSAPVLVDLELVETPAPEPAVTLTPTPSPTPVPALAGFIVGIDPGHQLHYDPSDEPVAPGSSTMKKKVAGGCQGVKSRMFEYEVNLAVGLLLRDYLEADGATVIMTRTVQDVNISNSARAILFNDANVDLGIRIHADKASDSGKRGVHMLIPKEYRTEWYDTNLKAAQCILEHYHSVTGLPIVKGTGISERGDQTGFNWCTRPVVCIEMGYLSNVEDDAFLSDPEGQKLAAKGLYDGIRAFLLGEPSSAGTDAGATPDAVEDADSSDE